MQPINSRDFDRQMRGLGAIESCPHLAVGCSGGGDSMALTLLANDWAKNRGGKITALIVDHRIRPRSKFEVRQVGQWLDQHDIDYRIILWRKQKVLGNLQARARMGRYRLMTNWCKRQKVLHLLLAHHLDDQAETFLLRLARGSGLEGLAAMGVISDRPDIQLLRPLLGFTHDKLIATLESYQQKHIEDPSNQNINFARVRIRRLLPKLAQEGMTGSRLATTSANLGRAREALEEAITNLAASCVTPKKEGYCLIQFRRLVKAPEEIGLRILGRVIATIGGAQYIPRMNKLEKLHSWLVGGCKGRSRTLGGCRILRWRGDRLLVCRELAMVTDEKPMCREFIWDNRFRFRLTSSRQEVAGLSVRRLGASGWRQIVEDQVRLPNCTFPPTVVPTLPAIWSLDVVVAVPHLKYKAKGGKMILRGLPEVCFTPVQRISSARFAFASPTFRAIL